MRATKENSKLEMTFDSLGDCCIKYCGSTDIKVLEIPKVWREGGKQFRVTNLWLPYFSKKVVVKTPRYCHIEGVNFNVEQEDYD